MRSSNLVRSLRLAVAIGGVGGAAGGVDALTPIHCGETLLDNTLAPFEVDLYEFSAAAGDRVLVTAGGSGLELELALAQAGGPSVPLSPIGPFPEFPSPHLSDFLPATGVYVIGVLRISETQSGGTPDYHITLESVTGRFNGASNWLPAPVCAKGGAHPFLNGTRVLRCGETIPLEPTTFESPGDGDTDSFTFHAAEGDVLRVGDDDGGTFYTLFDPNGEIVPLETAAHCDLGGDCATPPLPSTGVYTLIAAGIDSDNEFEYRVGLDSLSGSFAGGSNGPPTPICGIPEDGTRNLCAGRLSARFGSVGESDADSYTSLGSAGDPSAFTLVPLLSTPTGDPEGFLFGPDGQLVTGGSLSATGVHTLIVANHGGPVQSYLVSMNAAACDNACRDGVDNDGDGFVDAADPGCTSRDDLSEQPECGDGIDNDGDGGVDLAGDAGCELATSFAEDPACSDGADNDGDGLVDFDGLGGAAPADPQCSASPSGLSELFTCGLGPELTLALGGLLAVRARRERRRAH